MEDKITVYISIGNSDDGLSQVMWADFIHSMELALTNLAYHQHGEWFSEPTSEYQNAIWCVEVRTVMIQQLKVRLSKLAKRFKQKSIAWVEAKEVELILSEE